MIAENCKVLLLGKSFTYFACTWPLTKDRLIIWRSKFLARGYLRHSCRTINCRGSIWSWCESDQRAVGSSSTPITPTSPCITYNTPAEQHVRRNSADIYLVGTPRPCDVSHQCRGPSRSPRTLRGCPTHLPWGCPEHVLHTRSPFPRHLHLKRNSYSTSNA